MYRADVILIHAQALGISFPHLSGVTHTLALAGDDSLHHVSCSRSEVSGRKTVSVGLDDIVTHLRQRGGDSCDCALLPLAVSIDDMTLQQSGGPLSWLLEATQQLHDHHLVRAMLSLAQFVVWDIGLGRYPHADEIPLGQLRRRWTSLINTLDAQLRLPGATRIERFAVLSAVHAHTVNVGTDVRSYLVGARLGNVRQLLMTVTDLRVRGYRLTTDLLLTTLKADSAWVGEVQHLGGLDHPEQLSLAYSALTALVKAVNAVNLDDLAAPLSAPDAQQERGLITELSPRILSTNIAALLLTLPRESWVHSTDADSITSGFYDSAVITTRSVSTLCRTPAREGATVHDVGDTVPPDVTTWRVMLSLRGSGSVATLEEAVAVACGITAR